MQCNGQGDKVLPGAPEGGGTQVRLRRSREQKDEQRQTHRPGSGGGF